MAKEDYRDMKAAVFLRSINAIEAQQKPFRNIRHIEGKIKEGSTSKVTVTAKYGKALEYTAKVPIEKVIAKGNENTYHQTEVGSQLQSK